MYAGPWVPAGKLQADGPRAQRIVRQICFYACFRCELTRSGWGHPDRGRGQSDVPFEGGLLHRVRVQVLARNPAFETNVCFI